MAADQSKVTVTLKLLGGALAAREAKKVAGGLKDIDRGGRGAAKGLGTIRGGKVQSEFGMINRGTVLAKRGLGGITKGAATAAKALGVVTVALGALAARGLVGGVKAGVDFEQQMANVQSRLMTTKSNMGLLEGQALKLGATTQFSAGEAAGGMDQLAAAGFSTNQILKTLPGTLSLAAASGTDLAAAAELQGAAIRGFGLKASAAGHVADVLALTVNKSALEMSDLGETLPYVASTARQTGTSFEQVAAAAGILGNAGIKGCYDRDTDVLTRDGFKSWENVDESDEFATVNPATGDIEYQHALRLIRYRHTGPMYEVRSKQVDLLVTPDHRMWVRRRGQDDFEVRRAHEVEGGNVEYQTGGLGWDGVDVDEHVLPGFEQNRGSWTKDIPDLRVPSDAWAEFLGYYIAEGSCDHSRGGYRVRVTQTKGETRTAMRGCFARLPFNCREEDAGFVFSDEQLYRELHHLGYAHEKHVPRYAKAWSPRLIRILMEAFRKGDGDANGALYTCSDQLASDCQELALKVGWAASVVPDRQSGERTHLRDGRTITATRTTWKVRVTKQNTTPRVTAAIGPVHLSRNTGRTPVREGWVDFDDEVFCAEVPNGLLIVRRGGRCVVSGNSMAGTALRTSMLRLTDPTKKMQGVFETMGLSAKDLAAQPLPKVIGMVAGALRKLPTRGEKVGAISAIFGKEAAPAMLNLMAKGRKGIDAFTRALERSKGAAKRAADIQRNTVKGAWDNFTGSIETASIKLTKRFQPAMKSALNVAAGAVNKLPDIAGALGAGLMGRKPQGAKRTISSGPTGVKSTVRDDPTKAQVIAGKIGGAARKIGAAAMDAGRQLLGAFKPAMPFFQNILLPLLIGIGKGVLGGVVAAFRVLVPIIKIVATVLGFVGKMAAPLKPVFAGIGMVIGFLLGGPILKALGMIPKLGIVFRVLGVPLRIVTGAVRGVIGVMGRLAGAFGRAFTMVSRFAGTLTGGARKAAVGAVNMVGGIINVISRLPGRAAALAGRLVSRIAGVLGSGVSRVASAAWKLGKGLVTGVVNAIKSAPGSIVSALLSLVPGPVKGVVKSVLGVVGANAHGGVVRSPLQVVGEHGPELAAMRTGSQVVTASDTRRMVRAGAGRAPTVMAAAPAAGPLYANLNVYLDGKVMHSGVHKVERQKQEAA